MKSEQLAEFAKLVEGPGNCGEHRTAIVVLLQYAHDLECRVEILKAALDKAEAAEDLRNLCSDLDAKLRASDLQVEALKNVLRGIEWRGDCLSSPPKFHCPDCGNEKTSGHTEDCTIGHALYGAFPPVTDKQDGIFGKLPIGGSVAMSPCSMPGCGKLLRVGGSHEEDHRS